MCGRQPSVCVSKALIRAVGPATPHPIASCARSSPSRPSSAASCEFHPCQQLCRERRVLGQHAGMGQFPADHFGHGGTHQLGRREGSKTALLGRLQFVDSVKHAFKRAATVRLPASRRWSLSAVGPALGRYVFDTPNGDGTMNVAVGRKPADKASLRGLKLPMGLHQLGEQRDVPNPRAIGCRLPWPALGSWKVAAGLRRSG